jgi:hypothetical protein
MSVASLRFSPSLRFLVGQRLIGVRHEVSKGVEDGCRMPALQVGPPETAVSEVARPHGVEL